jgi:hypothetical protein
MIICIVIYLVTNIRSTVCFCCCKKHTPGFVEHALSGIDRCSSILGSHMSHIKNLFFMFGTKSDKMFYKQDHIHPSVLLYGWHSQRSQSYVYNVINVQFQMQDHAHVLPLCDVCCKGFSLAILVFLLGQRSQTGNPCVCFPHTCELHCICEGFQALVGAPTSL